MTEEEQKRLTIYLPVPLYEWVRKKSFQKRITMSKFIRDHLLPTAKLSSDLKEFFEKAEAKRKK